ncbi:cytochrome P450 [Myxococcus stipitatus]|uniref:cytochrome P450 n=1 Tax=Myxococcus stipitatus TaxID=83455 RepID=UPI0031451F1C
MHQPPLPPHASGVPWVGDSVEFGRNPKRFVLKRQARLGPVFMGHILGASTAVMVGPQALRFVLSSHRHHFVSGPGWPRGLGMLMSGALMMKDGDVQVRTRRLLAPALAGSALASYTPVMEATARRHLERWAQQGRLSLYDGLKGLTFDTASQLLFGTPEGADTGRLGKLFATYTAGMQGLHPVVPLRVPFTPFGRAFAARSEMLKEVTRIIQEREGSTGSDALARLLESRKEQGEGPSADALAEQAFFLLFAGHESTSSLTTSACLELSRHPDLLDSAREEVESLGEGPLSMERVERLPFLEQVLLETERLHPPFSGSFRQVVKSFEFNGFHVPEGCRVFYSINGTHGDPATFPEPERFTPGRFTPEAARCARHELGLVGFGAGPRSCLGMGFAKLQAKVVLALLLRDYEWGLLPRQSLDPVYLPSLFPKDHLRVSFRRRSVRETRRRETA